MKITVISVQTADAKIMAEPAERLKDLGIIPEVFAINSDDADDDILIYQELYRNVLASDFVFLRCMSDTARFKRFHKLEKAFEQCKGYVLLYSGNTEVTIMHRDKFRGNDDEFAGVCRYCASRGAENEYGMFCYMARLCGYTDVDPPEPVLQRTEGLYHQGFPRDVTMEQYLPTLKEDRMTAGILFASTLWVYNNLDQIDALVKAFEDRGMNTIPAFYSAVSYSAIDNPGAKPTLMKYFTNGKEVIIDVLVVVTSFSIMGNSRETKGVGTVDEENYFRNILNVPVIHAMTVTGEYNDYENDKIGLNKHDITANVAFPEIDGDIIGYPICYTPKKSGMKRAIPIHDRIERTVDLAYNWAKLGYTAPSRRKVAILMWQSRPDSGSIGNAAGLDTPESVVSILQTLASEGYTVDDVPANGKEFIKEVLEGVTNDLDNLSSKTLREKAVDMIGTSEYRKQFESIPEWDQEQMRKDWGEPPGTICVDGEDIVIPGIVKGNVFIGYQPLRGLADKMEQNIHDPVLFAQHQYLAYYRWIHDVFKADMVIHVGTHGTIEWLPGKNVGMSAKCDPDVVLGGLPNLYPYIVDDPGEGIQCKRRINSVLIGHMPPTMARAGQYKEIEEVEIPLQDYFRLKATASGERKEVLISQILESAREHKMLNDLDLPKDITPEEFEEHIVDLHEYLSEVKDALVRSDLHVLGRIPVGQHLDEMIYTLMRLDNGDVKSLRDAFADNAGYDFQSLLDNPAGITDGKVNSEITDELDAAVQEFVSFCRENDFDIEVCISRIKEIHGRITSELEESVRFMCEKVAPNVLKMSEEIGNMMDGLDGQYVLPGPSGAPTRGNADILPMGRNYYSLDPDTVPSRSAWEIGKRMADQMIEKYTSEKGEFPREVGFIIWATDTMKTGGDDVAYILWLMGVKPVWSKTGGQVIDLEVVPLEELKRPRVDVTVNITGLFRDTFPNIIDLLDDAVKLVASLDESDEDNSLAANLRKDIVEGIAEGLTPDEARRRNSVRIFGAPPGGYGTGVNKAIETGAWKTVQDLADVYIDWCSNGYEKGNYGQKMKSEFIRRFSRVGVTVKNMPDREIDLLDCDDVYEYLGGMNAFVRAYGRKDAMTVMGDGSNPKKTKVRSTKDELRYTFRSKVLNPKFINGLKEHGYRGAAEMANLTEFTMAWGATSDVTEDWMYEGLADKFLLDQDTKEWMEDVNPYAMMNILKRLEEAIERGLWDATDEYKQKLRDLYLEAEERIEELTDRNA